MKILTKTILLAVIMLCTGLSALAQSTYTVTFHDKILDASSPKIPWYTSGTDGTFYAQPICITPDTYYGDKTPFINTKNDALLTVKSLSNYGGKQQYGVLAYIKKVSSTWKQYGFAGKNIATYQFGFVSKISISYYEFGAYPTVTAPCYCTKSSSSTSTDTNGLSYTTDVFTFDQPVNTFEISLNAWDEKPGISSTLANSYRTKAINFATTIDKLNKAILTNNYQDYTGGRFILIRSIKFEEEYTANQKMSQIESLSELLEEKDSEIKQLAEEKRQMLNEDTHDVNRDGQISIADIADEVNAVLHPLDANGREGVNLGLPSQAIWATKNVGSASPKDPGIFLSWGETRAKARYEPEYYIYQNTNGVGYTKYYYDGSTELALEDDAAHVNWGGSWRMPSKEDFEELATYCKWEIESNDGSTYIYKVTGPNGNYILLPANGAWAFNMDTYYNSCPMYWTRSLDANYAPYGLNGVNVKYNYSTGLSEQAIGTYSYRCYGFHVRPVMKR